MRFFSTFILVLFTTVGFSQNRFLVVFKDKISSGFVPEQYFDTAATKSFNLQGLPEFDWYDLPVNSEYTQEVSLLVDSVRFDLRWFNGIAVYGSEIQIATVKQLPFVKEVITLNSTGELLAVDSNAVFDMLFNTVLKKQFEVFDWQLSTMGASEFKSRNIDGSGIRVCVLDVGFPNVDVDPVTKHIFNGNYIEGWDFIRDKPLKYKGFKHGREVLSFIAGKVDSHQVGLAPNIELLLARTEWMLTEKRFEEEVWIKAVEWAHRKGARLVNSSLGYNTRDHDHNELDGKSALISLAGNLAARKGMLVINAAGNEGESAWKRIVVPADADSVLAVGGINDETGVRSSFSSYGPTKDLRVKPNVCALGSVYLLEGNKLDFIEGTSYAAPLVTGFAACVLQLNPSLKPIELMDTLQKVSSLYPYYDYSHGYGVPQASKLFGDTVFRDTASVVLLKSPNYLQEKYYYFKYMQPAYEGTQIFYHIQSSKGFIKSYYVVKFDSEYDVSPRINFRELSCGDIIRVWHRGTYIEKVIE